ncbi:MAG: hypothetical protein KDE56_30510 [Anaerolineales bacterium]|nr:hypothetical protein [Anaerolineales bacterium]
MKLPWFGRKKQQPLTVEDHKRPLSPDIDHTIDRRLYYRPIEPGAACPRCHKTLIQESATYAVVTFDNHGQETDRLMVGSDFGHYCPNCPTVVINPADVEPYLAAARTQYEVGQGFAILGRIPLDGFTAEEQNTPIGELESIPLVPFHRSSTQSKPKNQRRKKRKKK